MSWLKIEDLAAENNQLILVDDFDATWIIGGSGNAAASYPSYGAAYATDIDNARQVGNQVYNFGVSADANFNVGSNPGQSGGKVVITVNPFGRT